MSSSYTWFNDSSTLLDTWYHLTTVLSGSTGRIYVNGVQTAEMTSMIPPARVVRTMDIGSGGSNVAIDELKFFNRALSPAEVLSDAQTNGPIV
jgi:hypothetical protein